jgi:5-methylcytosine-specific restriction endonuclease McrA
MRAELRCWYGWHWRRFVRPRVLMRAQFRCEHCGRRPPLDVAHLDALNPADPYNEDKLAALCRKCHNRLDYRVAQRRARETRSTRKDLGRRIVQEFGSITL